MDPSAPDPTPATRRRERLISLLLVALLALLAKAFLATLDWPLQNDTAYLHYLGWLVADGDRLPYRDFVEINLPGIYLLHAAIGSTLGWEARALRWADLAWQLVFLVATFGFMRRFGRRTAVAACLLTGFTYLSFGIGAAMQRDWLLLLPILLATAWTLDPRGSRPAGLVVPGLLVGLAACLKPHAAGTAGCLILYRCFLDEGCRSRTPSLRRRLAVTTAQALAGLVIPVAAMALWMWQTGALPEFLAVWQEVLPSYRFLDRTGRVLGGGDLLHHTWQNLIFPAYVSPWAILAGVLAGAAQLRRGDAEAERTRPATLLLIVLAVWSWIYPVFPGKFYWYDTFPALYFLGLLACTAFEPKPFGRVDRILAPVVSLLLLVTTLPMGLQLARGLQEATEAERIEAAAAFLSSRALPGDGALLLDTVSGNGHAILHRARLPLDGPMILEFPLYVPATTTLLRELRSRMVRVLSEEPPRFVVRDLRPDDRARGPGARTAFPELEAALGAGYAPVFRHGRTLIYERRDGGFAPPRP